MNGLIYNNAGYPLAATAYGQDGGGFAYPFQTDTAGQLLLAEQLWQINGTNTDVRNLSPMRDTLNIQGSSAAVRGLSPSRDFVSALSQSNIVTTQSGTVPLLLAPLILLTTDMSAYSNNTFWVRNTGIGISISITLQLAPIDSDAYYVDDQSQGSLLAGGLSMFRPTRTARYARLRIVGLVSLYTTTATAYYMGQTDC